MNDPVIHDENGRLRLELPTPPSAFDFYPVSGAVLAGYVDQVNGLRAVRDRLGGLLARALDALAEALGQFGEPCTCRECAGDADQMGPPPLVCDPNRDLDRMEGP